jgi:dipeptidase E
MLRGSGVADDLVSRVRRGLPYLGLSAGAMVVAPDLAPLRLTSPFAGGAGDGPLPGLALTDRLVLPHHDRDGRRARHEAAAVAHPEAHLVPLTDNEALVLDDEVAVVWSVGGTGRDAEPRRTI